MVRVKRKSVALSRSLTQCGAGLIAGCLIRSTMEQDNYDRSVKRANAGKIHTRILPDGTVKDFRLRTLPAIGRARWYWLPYSVENVYLGWNEKGGAAKTVWHRETFWLCMGWSTMKTLNEGE